MYRLLEALLAVCFAAGTLPGAVHAGAPPVSLEGTSHRVTFTSPGVYDFTANESSEYDGVANATIITHDVNGRIEGTIIDKSDGVTLTTDLQGTCRTRHGRTVLKIKEQGHGEIGGGGSIEARGVRKSTVYGTGASATLHSVLRMKICVTQKKPFSKRTFRRCHNGGGGTNDTLLGDVGDWSVFMESLEQPVVGKILGTGSVTTNIHSPTYQRTTPMIVAGSVRDDGVSRLTFTPLYPGGDGPVTITARVVAGPGVQFPAVIEILAVEGKLLGQRIREIY